MSRNSGGWVRSLGAIAIELNCTQARAKAMKNKNKKSST
jgi:hypothetical protein